MPRKSSSRIVRLVTDRLWARDRMQMQAADALLSAIERRKPRAASRSGGRAPSPRRGFKSVLCPIDFSRHSRLALRYAEAIAEREGAVLRVVHVNDPLLAAAAAAALPAFQMERRTQQQLQAFADATIAPGSQTGLRLTTEVAVGAPAEAILRSARRAHSDLIVLGTRGASGAARLLLGSTTMKVLQKSTIPVLAIPPIRKR